MAIPFPAALGPHTGSVLDDDDGVVMDRTDDGAMAVRQMYPETYYDITLRWKPLTSAQHTQLRTFLADNRINVISATIDGVDYEFRQSDNLRVTWSHGNGLVDASVKVRGTRV